MSILSKGCQGPVKRKRNKKYPRLLTRNFFNLYQSIILTAVINENKLLPQQLGKHVQQLRILLNLHRYFA